MIRVGAPSEKDIGLVLDKVAKKEGINIRKEVKIKENILFYFTLFKCINCLNFD